MGIEPTYLAWKASVLPLNYTRKVGVTGFEPATSWSQTRRSSQAEPHPVIIVCISQRQVQVYPIYPLLSSNFVIFFTYFAFFSYFFYFPHIMHIYSPVFTAKNQYVFKPFTHKRIPENSRFPGMLFFTKLI